MFYLHKYKHKHRHRKKLKIKRLTKPTPEQVSKAYTVKNADVTKTLSEAETKRVLEKSLQVNKRWDEWWTHTADVDVQRVAEAVNQGVNNGQTVEEVTAVIRGTKDGNYEDGLLSKNRIDARRMARTITAGIANEAKDQFYRDNADVLLGIEWLDTLDGRTCFGCASLSRMQWKVDEPHPIPPLHPNCRCVLLPVTALSALVNEARPAAKSDFMADAKRAYEKKHPDKKFEDLAESTRKKYYYDAIHEYEARTGQPAFEMVGGGAKFKDYFENIMAEQQRKDWLGPERYKLWKSGKYKFDDFVTPYPNRNMTVAELKDADKKSFYKGINIFKKNKTPSFNAQSIEEITAQTKQILDIDDVDLNGITDIKLLNRMNQTLYDLKREYPDLYISSVRTTMLPSNTPAAMTKLNGLQLNSDYINQLSQVYNRYKIVNGKYINEYGAMYYTKEIETLIYHETGHSFYNMKIGHGEILRKKSKNSAKKRYKLAVLKQIYRKAMQDGYASSVSNYAMQDESEFFSEIFTASHLDKNNIPNYIKTGIMEVLR